MYLHLLWVSQGGVCVGRWSLPSRLTVSPHNAFGTAWSWWVCHVLDTAQISPSHCICSQKFFFPFLNQFPFFCLRCLLRVQLHDTNFFFELSVNIHSCVNMLLTFFDRMAVSWSFQLGRELGQQGCHAAQSSGWPAPRGALGMSPWETLCRPRLVAGPSVQSNPHTTPCPFLGFVLMRGASPDFKHFFMNFIEY